MTSAETRYPCPVCLGVRLEKVILHTEPGSSRLVLDHCARCGGVWFDAGEVQQLRNCESETLWRELIRREDPHVMLCHICRAPLARSADRCEACNWKVELDCPTCQRTMEVAEHGGMKLDVCRHCRGVWFDHTELAGIWKMELGAAMARRRGSRLGNAADTAADVVLLDALLFDPFLLYYGMSAGGHILGSAAEGIAHAGSAGIEGLAGAAGGGLEGVAGAASGGIEALGDVAGAAGEAASSVFETIVEIIGGLFG